MTLQNGMGRTIDSLKPRSQVKQSIQYWRIQLQIE